MPTNPDLTAELLGAYSASARVNAYLVERLDPDVAGRAESLRPAGARSAQGDASRRRPGTHGQAPVHDGHHRGQILLQARLLGHPITIDTMSGMWLWTARARE